MNWIENVPPHPLAVIIPSLLNFNFINEVNMLGNIEKPLKINPYKKQLNDIWFIKHYKNLDEFNNLTMQLHVNA